MNHPKVVILGASGHAKVVIDIFEKEGVHEIIGILDAEKTPGDKFMGYEILGRDEDLPALVSSLPPFKVFIAIGDNWIRQKVAAKIKALLPETGFASTIHPSAQIGKGVQTGQGVAVMAGAIINSDSIIGDFTIINTKASLDHEGTMLPYSSLAPNVTAGGKVTIGTCSFVAISATIRQGVTIGNNTVIGAGALVLKDFGDDLIVYGAPAKIQGKREPGRKYQ